MYTGAIVSYHSSGIVKQSECLFSILWIVREIELLHWRTIVRPVTNAVSYLVGRARGHRLCFMFALIPRNARGTPPILNIHTTRHFKRLGCVSIGKTFCSSPASVQPRVGQGLMTWYDLGLHNKFASWRATLKICCWIAGWKSTRRVHSRIDCQLGGFA